MGAMTLGPGDGYNASAKVSVQELLAKDAEDESLRRYKEQLLGAAAKVLARANASATRARTHTKPTSVRACARTRAGAHGNRPKRQAPRCNHRTQNHI